MSEGRVFGAGAVRRRPEPTECVAPRSGTGLPCGRPPEPSSPVPLCVHHLAEILAFMRERMAAELPESVTEVLGRLRQRRGPRVETEASVVYYLHVGALVKIGTTNDLAQRLESYPPDSVLLGVERGGTALERIRLEQFADYRYRGEWFRYVEDIVRHARNLPAIA